MSLMLELGSDRAASGAQHMACRLEERFELRHTVRSYPTGAISAVAFDSHVLANLQSPINTSI